MSTIIYVYISQMTDNINATEFPWQKYYIKICKSAVPVLNIIIAARNSATNFTNFSLFIFYSPNSLVASEEIVFDKFSASSRVLPQAVT